MLWAGSKDGLASVGSNGPTLSVSQRASTFVCSASRHRPTSVRTSASLLLVRSGSFYWLRQLKRVRRSLHDESMKTLDHAFMTSRVDYCNTVRVGAPKSVSDKLQRVLNAAARSHWYQEVRSRTFSTILHADLHWLDVSERVLYKLALTVH